MSFSLASLPPWLLRVNARLGPSSMALRSGGFRPGRSAFLISLAYRRLEASWIPAEGESSAEGYGGWAIRRVEVENRKAVPRFVVAGIGALVAILMAAIAHFSLSRKGLKFPLDAPFHALQELLASSELVKNLLKKNPTSVDLSHGSEEKLDDELNALAGEGNAKETSVPVQVSKRKIVPVPVDAAQQEALYFLKKLKIIENDVSAEELCTRREYATWLFKANSMLERDPRHKIVPLTAKFCSVVTAFDDVTFNDPDFLCIQALAEAGILHSKLSTATITSLSDGGGSTYEGIFNFYPESFLSRFDLMNWKAFLEYPSDIEVEEKMSRMKAGFLDFDAFSPEASPQLLLDLMSSDKSITRRVFGNTRRLQPQKPATKAQAAVALASGKMAVAIQNELLRLEAENLSRLSDIEEIRSELIRKGEIRQVWQEKLNKETDRGLEVERNLQAALIDLEAEKIARDKALPDYIKEKAALDCQKELLFSIKEEVDGMSTRLASERANYVAAQHSLEALFADLHEKQEAICETKSKLESEKEALQILRSWVEEEARRTQARAKVLEEAVQRWKWRLPSLNYAESADSNDPKLPVQTNKDS